MADQTPADVIAEAIDRFHRCAEAESKQRERMVAAKHFRNLQQWPEAIKIQREGGGSIAGQSPQPPRPCLVVDRLSQPVRQVSNTVKNADFGFDVLPVGMGADQETAEIYKGYLRRVQNQARGDSPVEWAADGAIEGGIGWFRLRADYVHETWDGEPTEEMFDQELRMERIANNLSVYCDPYAVRPTRSDAHYMFVTDRMDRTEFTRTYPEANVIGLDQFEATGDPDEWVDKDSLRIAEYWRIVYTDKPYYWLKDGTIHEGTAPKFAPVRMSRVMHVPTVKMSKITCCDELEKYDWEGSRIPLIPVLGEELNVDGQQVLRGIIEMGMDAQRMVNYTYSGGVEIYALGMKRPPMVPGAAVQNYKNIWDARNVVNFSYLPYDAWDAQGRALPPPIFDSTEAPIQASVELMRVSEDAIKASTSTGDASLGNTNPNERSGRALQSLQAQSDLANSNYPDNVKRAYIYAAELAMEVIPKITRPGQILHILGMDDKPEQVMVGRPFKPGPNGVPVPAPQEITPELAKVQGSLYKFYDLNNGTYHCTVTVGKATATKQQEGAAALGELLPHLPPEMQAKIIPDYIKQLSFPGAQGIAEKLEPSSPDAQGLPQAQQQIAMLQEQIQQLQPLANDNAAKMELEKAKQEAEDKRQAQDHAFQLQLQREKMAGEIEKARITAAKESANIAQEASEEKLATGLEMAGDIAMQQADHAHQTGMAAMGHAVSADQAAEGRAADAESAEASRAHEAEMAAQAAQQQTKDTKD